MRICNHWPNDPPKLRDETLRHHCEPLRLRDEPSPLRALIWILLFTSYAYPDSAFQSNADLDPNHCVTVTVVEKGLPVPSTWYLNRIRHTIETYHVFFGHKNLGLDLNPL
jgi:hypothetical protein